MPASRALEIVCDSLSAWTISLRSRLSERLSPCVVKTSFNDSLYVSRAEISVFV